MQQIIDAFSDPLRWTPIATLFLFLLWETTAPFFQFFKNANRERAFHLGRNITLGLINSILVTILFTALWVRSSTLAAEHDWGLLHLVDIPMWLAALLAVLLFDIWTYWWHRFNHVIPFLWRFHRVHHSDNRMDVTTATRFHVGEIAMSSILRIPLILIIGADIWHLAIYQALLTPIVQFHHANIKLPNPADRILRVWITTPDMHKVHHSRLQPETDSNYTSLLSIWDRLFGSFKIRHDPDTIQFGLSGYDEDTAQTLPGMLKTPFSSKFIKKTEE